MTFTTWQVCVIAWLTFLFGMIVMAMLNMAKQGDQDDDEYIRKLEAQADSRAGEDSSLGVSFGKRTD